MALIPWREKSIWSPFYDLENIQNEMNKLFNFSLSKLPERKNNLGEAFGLPELDVIDSKDNIIVKADIPGLNKEDLDVNIEENTLIIKGEKKQEREVKENDCIRSERFYGRFNRAISLPVEVDASKVNASYKNGVLELTLPKKEGAKLKSIRVDVK